MIQTQQPPQIENLGQLNRQLIVILDFGSQYSELIARRIRETQVYWEVLSYRTTAAQLQQLNPKGIILSGGPNSVYDNHAPQCDPKIWELGIPILGVCYGMQLMVNNLGGKVAKAERGEYGKAPLYIDDPTDLLTNVEDGTTMWMSHGDSVTQLPSGFEVLAHTNNTPCAAIAEHQKKLYGVQFHPEVVHSIGGFALIRNFVYHICEWTNLDDRSICLRSNPGNSRQSRRKTSTASAIRRSRLIHTCLFTPQSDRRSTNLRIHRSRFHAKVWTRTPS